MCRSLYLKAVTSGTYDATTGWLLQKTYPDGSDAGTTPDPGPSYTYTSAGRLKTRQNARGQTTRYDYDGGGRLIAELHFTSGTTPSASAGNDATTHDAAYTHDSLGRPPNHRPQPPEPPKPYGDDAGRNGWRLTGTVGVVNPLD